MYDLKRSFEEKAIGSLLSPIRVAGMLLKFFFEGED